MIVEFRLRDRQGSTFAAYYDGVVVLVEDNACAVMTPFGLQIGNVIGVDPLGVQPNSQLDRVVAFIDTAAYDSRVALENAIEAKQAEIDARVEANRDALTENDFVVGTDLPIDTVLTTLISELDALIAQRP